MTHSGAASVPRHRRVPVLFLLCLLALSLPAAPVRADAVLTISEYAGLLRHFADAADRAAALTGGVYLAERDAAVALLPDAVNVATPGGETAVNHRLLLDPLRALGGATARPAARLALQRAAAEARQRAGLAESVGRVQPGLDLSDAASQLAAMQQSRARAQRSTPVWLRTLLDRAQRLVAAAVRAVAGLFTTTPGGAVGRVILRLAAIAVLCAAGWFLWRWLRVYLRSSAADGGLAVGRQRRAASATPEALRAEAARLAAAGDFLGALRTLHLALLRRLDAAGLVEFRPAAANGEYLRNLRATRPDLYDRFRRLTNLLESRWYGGRAATAADVTTGEGLLGALWEEVGASAPGQDPN